MATGNPAQSTPRLLALGDAAWTVEFGQTVDPALHGRVLGLAAALTQARAAAGERGNVAWHRRCGADLQVADRLLRSAAR